MPRGSENVTESTNDDFVLNNAAVCAISVMFTIEI